MKETLHKSQIDSVKANVIVAVLDFIQDGNLERKSEAIELLKAFSKFYNIPLKKKNITFDVNKHFRQFILNHDGYQKTIINLFNSLAYGNQQNLN